MGQQKIGKRPDRNGQRNVLRESVTAGGQQRKRNGTAPEPVRKRERGVVRLS